MPDQQELSPGRLKSLLGRIDPSILQQVMPLTGGVVTMMFTDIVNSTAIKAGMGDDPYFKHVLGPYNRLIRDRIAAHNGRELKTIGDAFLVGFAEPRKAVACAVEVQQRLATSPIATAGDALQVRLGLPTGEPIVFRDLIAGLV